MTFLVGETIYVSNKNDAFLSELQSKHTESMYRSYMNSLWIAN